MTSGRSAKLKTPLLLLGLLSLALWARFGIGPAYVTPDGVGYFAYLRGVLVDGSLDFADTFREMQIYIPQTRTPTGYASNIWPVGSAFFLSPFCLAARALHALFRDRILFPPESWMVLFANAGSSFYGLAAIWICALGLREAGLCAGVEWAGAALAAAGTPLLFYIFSAPLSAHPVSAFAVSLFLFYWVRSARCSPEERGRWAALGLLLGLAAAVRSENAFFACAPLAEWVRRRFASPRTKAACAILFLAGCAAGFSPQLIVWKILYGSFLASPQGFNLALRNWALKEVLFSPYHGLLGWTPLFLLGWAGLALPFREEFPGLRAGLGSGVALQVLLLAFSVAWWCGYSFGIRLFTNCVFPTGLGLGLFLARAQDRGKTAQRAAWALAIAPALWTTSLCLQAMIGWIDPNAVIFSARSFWVWQERLLRTPLAAAARFFHNRYLTPFESLIVFLVLALAFWSLKRAARGLAGLRTAAWASGLAVLLLFFDARLVQCGFHHSLSEAQERERAAWITQDQLARIFQSQAWRRRWLYYRSRGEAGAAEAALERSRALLPDQPPPSGGTGPWR